LIILYKNSYMNLQNKDQVQFFAKNLLCLTAKISTCAKRPEGNIKDWKRFHGNQIVEKW